MVGDNVGAGVNVGVDVDMGVSVIVGMDIKVFIGVIGESNNCFWLTT